MKSKDKKIEEIMGDFVGVGESNFGVKILKLDWGKILKKTGIKILIIFLIILVFFMVLK